MMTCSAYPFARVLFVVVVAALPCQAWSSASSATSAASASVGSLSDSLKTSSGSSTKTVAEGDYKVVDVTAAERPDGLRLKLQPVAHPGDDNAAIYLELPRPALDDRAAQAGDVVRVRERPYGYEFAWADTRIAFFLVLADDWQRELDPRPVKL
jgi:hypothetical protein